MEKFFSKIRPIAAFIGLGLLGTHLILLLVYLIGAQAGFVGYLRFTVELALVGALAFAYFAKKEELLKVTMGLLLAFFAVAMVLSGPNDLGLGGDPGMVFGILALVAAVGALALFLLRFALPGVFDKPLFKLIILALVATVVLFSFICSIFVFVEAGKAAADAHANGYEIRIWPQVIYCIDQLIVVPAAFLFGVFVYEQY